jgi:hypothetical protein
MGVQQRVRMDAGPVDGPERGITANFLLVASLLSVVVPLVLLFAVVAGSMVLLQ